MRRLGWSYAGGIWHKIRFFARRGSFNFLVSPHISMCSPFMDWAFCAQVNQGRHFPLLWYVSLQKSIFSATIMLWRKASSLTRLCGLHMLTWDDNLRTLIMPRFLQCLKPKVESESARPAADWIHFSTIHFVGFSMSWIMLDISHGYM